MSYCQLTAEQRASLEAVLSDLRSGELTHEELKRCIADADQPSPVAYIAESRQFVLPVFVAALHEIEGQK